MSVLRLRQLSILVSFGGFRIAALKCHDRLNFDEKILLYESIYHEKRVGWIVVGREHRREQLLAHTPEFRDVLRVHQIPCELHDVGKGRLDRLQPLLDVRQNLFHQRVEIVPADDSAIEISYELASNEDQLRGANPGDLAVET
jgi:hypothetical protein